MRGSISHVSIFVAYAIQRYGTFCDWTALKQNKQTKNGFKRGWCGTIRALSWRPTTKIRRSLQTRTFVSFRPLGEGHWKVGVQPKRVCAKKKKSWLAYHYRTNNGPAVGKMGVRDVHKQTGYQQFYMTPPFYKGILSIRWQAYVVP